MENIILLPDVTKFGVPSITLAGPSEGQMSVLIIRVVKTVALKLESG
jgi:hypothetical protein